MSDDTESKIVTIVVVVGTIVLWAYLLHVFGGIR